MRTRTKICLVLVMAIAVVFLTACSDRYPIDRADFIATMEAEGFEIRDVRNCSEITYSLAR